MTAWLCWTKYGTGWSYNLNNHTPKKFAGVCRWVVERERASFNVTLMSTKSGLQICLTHFINEQVGGRTFVCIGIADIGSWTARPLQYPVLCECLYPHRSPLLLHPSRGAGGQAGAAGTLHLGVPGLRRTAAGSRRGERSGQHHKQGQEELVWLWNTATLWLHLGPLAGRQRWWVTFRNVSNESWDRSAKRVV